MGLTWTPPQPNGWHPKLSPSGRYVAYGWTRVWTYDRETDTVRDHGSGWPAGWYDADTLGITDLVPGDDQARAFRLVRMQTGSTAVVSLPARTLPSVCGGGHVFGAVPHGDVWRLYRDGDPLQTVDCYGTPNLSADGRYLVQPVPAQSWRPAVIDAATGLVLRVLPSAVQNARPWSGPDGCYVTFDRGTQAWVNTPDGQEFQVYARTPEWSGALAWRDGALWIWTWAELGPNNQCFVVGRPVDSADAICVPMIGLGLDAVWDGGAWVLTGHDDKGRMSLHTVEPDAPRVDVRTLLTPFTWPMPSTDWPRGMGWGWLGGEADAPGSLTSGADHVTGRPMVEAIGTNADGSPWIRPEDYPRLAAIFVSPKDARDRVAERDAALALAQQTGAAVLVYDDGPDTTRTADGSKSGAYTLRLELDWYRARGVAAIAGLMVYPTENANGWQIDYWHEPDCQQLGAAGYPVVLIQAGYTQSGRWPHKTCAEMLDLSDALARRHPHVLGTLMFGWRRRREPADWTAWLEARCQVLAGRPPLDLSRWPRTPRPDPVTPAPEPPAPVDGAGPEPVPAPAPTPTKRAGKASKAAWVPVVAAGLVGLVRWLRRRR